MVVCFLAKQPGEQFQSVSSESYDTVMKYRKWAGRLIDIDGKPKVPMEHLNIAEFNRGQASKLIRELAEKDKAAFVNKNEKPIAVLISYNRYKRLLEDGIDVNDY